MHTQIPFKLIQINEWIQKKSIQQFFPSSKMKNKLQSPVAISKYSHFHILSHYPSPFISQTKQKETFFIQITLFLTHYLPLTSSLIYFALIFPVIHFASLFFVLIINEHTDDLNNEQTINLLDHHLWGKKGHCMYVNVQFYTLIYAKL